MPAIEQHTPETLLYDGNWKISSKAVDLLRCFMTGLDDVIIRLALEIAQQKQGTGDRTEVRIDADDIEQAANSVLDQIRAQNLPAHVKSDIDGMDECLKEKCRAIR